MVLYHIHESAHKLRRVTVHNASLPWRLNRPHAPPVAGVIVVVPEQARVLVDVQDVPAGLDAAHPEWLPGGAHRRQLVQRAAGKLQELRPVVANVVQRVPAADLDAPRRGREGGCVFP